VSLLNSAFNFAFSSSSSLILELSWEVAAVMEGRRRAWAWWSWTT
jgi:hypothetical protein